MQKSVLCNHPLPKKCSQPTVVPTRAHIAIVLQQRDGSSEHGIVGTANRRIITPMIHTQLGVLKECPGFLQMLRNCHEAFFSPRPLCVCFMPPVSSPSARRTFPDQTAVARRTWQHGALASDASRSSRSRVRSPRRNPHGRCVPRQSRP